MDHHIHAQVSRSILTQDAIQALSVLLDLKLTNKQQLVFDRLQEDCLQGNMTCVVWSLSEELDLSEPTVRRTLQLLRSLGLVSCGSKSSRGSELRLTPLGQKVLEVMSRRIES